MATTTTVGTNNNSNTLTQSLPVVAVAGNRKRPDSTVGQVMEARRLSRVPTTLFVWALVALIMNVHDYGHHYDNDHHHGHEHHGHHYGNRNKRSTIGNSAGFLPGVEGALRRIQVGQPSAEPIGAEIVLNRTTITTTMTTHTGGVPPPSTTGAPTTTTGSSGSSSSKRGKRPVINPKWINPQDQLSPEYARVKKVACGYVPKTANPHIMESTGRPQNSVLFTLITH